MKLLINGQVIDSKEAVISALDHGFLYGIGLFETFRTYNGSPWLLEQHAHRLQAGCEQLGIRYTPNLKRMEELVEVALKENGLSDGYIRWSVSAGEGAIGLPSEPYTKPNEIIYAKELNLDDTPANRKGKVLRLLNLKRSTPEASFRLKSFHYMNNIKAKQELITSGAGPTVEGLFLDHNGFVVEGIVSNIFWVKDGVLHTPSASTGLLEGVTREYVWNMALNLGINVQQGCYLWEELQQADEVFLTNSIQEIVPVIGLEDELGNQHPISSKDQSDTLTQRLMKEYRNAAEKKG